MLARSEAKYIRISAKKLRLVLEHVKGKTVEDSVFILDNMNKRAAGPVKKTINSAFSNLNSNRQDKFLAKDIMVSSIKADGGPMLQRFRAATMGRATPIRHRTSHIRVELDKVAVKKIRRKQGKSDNVVKIPESR